MRMTFEPIIEYAKEIYLAPNDKGDHKYSLQNMADLIRQKFDKKLHRDTIRVWADKYGWKTLWNEAVKRGITQAIKSDKDKELDEKYEELIARKKRDDFLRATQLKVLGFKYIQENGFASVSDALRAVEIGMKYTEDLVIEIKTESEEVKRIEESTEALRKAVEFLNRDSGKE